MATKRIDVPFSDDDGTIRVNVEVTLSSSGRFGVHHAIDLHDRWMVTHVPTGYFVVMCRGQFDALRCMDALDALPDECLSSDDIKVVRGARASIEPIAERYDVRQFPTQEART